MGEKPRDHSPKPEHEPDRGRRKDHEGPGQDGSTGSSGPRQPPPQADSDDGESLDSE
jgi:hypothetical protein